MQFLNVKYNNISTLPINLAYLTSITRFRFSKIEINSPVPEGVKTWLKNYQRQNQNYLDRQNVHDTRINDSLIKSINQLKGAVEDNLLSISEMHIRINNDTILKQTVKELLKEK